MGKIIFITKSLDSKCFDQGSVNTSSAAFEYGLVGALNSKSDLVIIYLGKSNADQIKVNGFQYCSINYNSIVGFFRLACAIYKNRSSNDLNIFTTGYYPVEIAVVIILSKILKCKSFGYVYDTHRQATSKMPMVKRMLANSYFNFGFYWVKKNSGLLILNDFFIKKKRITTPYLKTKIGINHLLNADAYTNADLSQQSMRVTKVIVFAGTINAENGANLLMDFVSNNRDVQFELHFYGSGEGASAVQELEKTDARVKYFGRIPEEVLQKKLVEADFLINLRDPVGLSIDYSFPSKLINFMSTGTPVISNRFPGLDDCYADRLHLIDNYEIESISRKMISLLKNNLNRNFGNSAKDFVYKENNWNNIADQITEFIIKT